MYLGILSRKELQYFPQIVVQTEIAINDRVQLDLTLLDVVYFGNISFLYGNCIDWTYQGLMYLRQVAAVIMDREYYQRPANARHRSLRLHRTTMSWAAAAEMKRDRKWRVCSLKYIADNYMMYLFYVCHALQ